jgi:anti-sigma factor RsiW
MPNCEAIDPLVTPYVDGQLGDPDRAIVDQHLRACAPCHSRVTAERAVRDLLQTRKRDLGACRASDGLRARCAAHARAADSPARSFAPPALTPFGARPAVPWRSRIAPLAAAASLVLIVGAAFLYQLTASSTRVMAAELAADHVKCFALNGVLHTHEDAEAVESSMLTWFDWPMRLPQQAAQAGLELVGSRPCIYGQGKIAHIMYTHNGEPVSLFMLPKSVRAQELVRVLGHQAAIWCAKDRTFVLVAREPKENVERMAAAVQASLR